MVLARCLCRGLEGFAAREMGVGHVAEVALWQVGRRHVKEGTIADSFAVPFPNI
jgi:hypothetical protein